MKQTNHSGTTVQSDLESSGSKKRNSKNHWFIAFHGKTMKWILVILGVAFFITVYVLANKNSVHRSTENESILQVNSRALEVEVLDGAENMRAAQRITNVLRSQGYDVVEMKRNSGGIVERTFVFDRLGNLEAARKLATTLGISQDKVFQQIDRNLYLDITVVVGKDFSHLKAFQLPTERNIH
jgi:hypothetical protein